jgi:hypothetical protein
MKPMLRRWWSAVSPAESVARSRPLKRTTPASGAISAAASISSVLLPEPLGPCIATISPAPTVSVTPSTARTISPPNPG